MSKRFKSQFESKNQLMPIPESPRATKREKNTPMKDVTNKWTTNYSNGTNMRTTDQNIVYRPIQYDFIECLENNWVVAPPDEFDNLNGSFISDKLLLE